MTEIYNLNSYDTGANKKKKMSKQQKSRWPSSTDQRPWSDLPEDLMESIMANILFTDQVCVRAVCKRWRSLRSIQPVKQIPWLLIWDDESLASCKLYDPVNKKTLIVDSTGLTEVSNATTTLWASKHGWLLISYSGTSSLFLLYNPFTHEKIQFPTLGNTNDIPDFAATFSSPPNSPDCIIFTTMYEEKRSRIWIRTCRVGENTWTTSNFYCKELFNAYSNVAYMDGLFYCLGTQGSLATFNATQQTWIVLDVFATVYHSLGPPIGRPVNSILLESGGELFLISAHVNIFKTSYRLDRSRMKWKTVDSFGDHVFFMGPKYGLVSDSATKKGIGNRIYYFREDSPKYFPMKSMRRIADCHVYNWINTEDCEMSLSFYDDCCNMAFVEPTV